jgi:hypothetical protein
MVATSNLLLSGPIAAAAARARAGKKEPPVELSSPMNIVETVLELSEEVEPAENNSAADAVPVRETFVKPKQQPSPKPVAVVARPTPPASPQPPAEPKPPLAADKSSSSFVGSLLSGLGGRSFKSLLDRTPSDERAAAAAYRELEAAAAAAATGGHFVTIAGYAPSGEEGAVEMEPISREEAEERVSGAPAERFAYLTVDEDPDGYPKVLCRNGFSLLYAPDSGQTCTAHIHRPTGCLPAASEAALFTDEIARKLSADELKRPARGEGLADEWASKLCLFDEHIEPNDLRQGGIGNCWLISAFSALAEFPQHVRSRIHQTSLSKCGRYDVSLFHPVEEKWVRFALDDRLPTNKQGRLRNVRLSVSGELWPVIFEKAFAAMWGSYANLDGGNPYVALKALTGVKGDSLLCFNVSKDTGLWQCWTPEFRLASEGGYPEARQLSEASWPDDGGRGSVGRDSDRMLDLLMWLDEGRSVMCCGSFGNDDTTTSMTGVVQGHAYALLSVSANLGPDGQFDLMKLRNPHGQGGQEWSGAWSDGHPIWDQYPGIKEKLMPAVEDDGTFWMERADFVNEFRSISICLSDKCAAERGKVSTYSSNY